MKEIPTKVSKDTPTERINNSGTRMETHMHSTTAKLSTNPAH